MITRYLTATLGRLLVLLAVGALGSAKPVAGQARDGTPVFLAIPEAFPEVEGRVVLLREPGRDIILLRESDAIPETLGVALDVLRRLGDRVPRRDRQAQMVPVTGYALTQPIASEQRDRLEAMVRRLRERPVTHLGNLGFGRSMPFRERG
jgi:hypothetical protein